MQRRMDVGWPEADLRRVEEVNSAATVAAIRDLRPHIVAVSGTNRVRVAVLEAAERFPIPYQ